MESVFMICYIFIRNEENNVFIRDRKCITQPTVISY